MGTEIRINRILGLREAPSEIIVQTSRSGEISLQSAALPFDALGMLRSAAERKRHLVLEVSVPDRQVIALYFPVTDRLIALSGDIERQGDISVQAMKHPSLYVLRADHPRYAELLALLIEAREGFRLGLEASLAIRPGDNAINDVLLVPQQHP